MDGFEAGVLRRLPLARGVLLAWRAAVSDAVLGEVFESARGRSYEDTLTFPELVRLFADAIVSHGGSGRQAMVRAQEGHRLNVSPQAAYGKLRRVPQEVSRLLLERGAQRLEALIPGPIRAALPASLSGFKGVTIDGKTIKNLAKRLKATRSAKGGLLGGRVLAALSMDTGLIASMQTHLDGYADEAAMLGALLPSTRRLIAGPRVYILDREFGYVPYLDQLAAGGDAFIVRRRKDTAFRENAPAKEGKDKEGRRYTEHWGVLETKHPARSLPVRQVSLERPGEDTIVVVTSLLDAGRYPATDILDAYLQRWGIERVFQQVTEVFGLQRLIGSSPCAAIFQFALCALWYNVIQVVKEHVAAGGRVTSADVSGEQLFIDTCRQFVALTELTGLEAVTEAVPRQSPLDQVRAQLLDLLPTLWTDRWRRAPPRRRAAARPKGRPRDHASAFRLMQRPKRPHPKGT